MHHPWRTIRLAHLLGFDTDLPRTGPVNLPILSKVMDAELESLCDCPVPDIFNAAFIDGEAYCGACHLLLPKDTGLPAPVQAEPVNVNNIIAVNFR